MRAATFSLVCDCGLSSSHCDVLVERSNVNIQYGHRKSNVREKFIPVYE